MSPRRNRSARPRKPREGAGAPVCHRPYAGEVTDCGQATERVRWSRHWRFVTCPHCKREGDQR